MNDHSIGNPTIKVPERVRFIAESSIPINRERIRRCLVRRTVVAHNAFAGPTFDMVIRLKSIRHNRRICQQHVFLCSIEILAFVISPFTLSSQSFEHKPKEESKPKEAKYKQVSITTSHTIANEFQASVGCGWRFDWRTFDLKPEHCHNSK